MKSITEINAIMETIPHQWRTHWCGVENGLCACLGCVQTGNRMIMVKIITGAEFRGDPEYIDETKIPKAIFTRYKITSAEWELWLQAQSPAD